jgi:HAD superfamily hydrolase (TIGR01509 family)
VRSRHYTPGAVDAVLFDLYDTLVWSEWPLLRERLADAIGRSTRDVMRGFIETRDARGLGRYGSAEGDIEAVLRAAGGSPTEDQVRSLTELETRALAEGGIHLYDDTLPVLRELRASGTPTGIVSNCDHWTRPVVDALGLEDEVDAVVLSFEVGVMKPEPAIYGIALDRMHAAPATTTFVDDQSAYLDGAAALGMRTIQIARPNDPNTPARGGHSMIEDLWPLVGGRRA